MDYLYDNYFPINTNHIKSRMESILKELTPAQLQWIAANREYGEKERYRVKKEVDDTLKNTPVIWDERVKIENLFKNNELDKAVDLYQDLLFERIIELDEKYEKIFITPYNLTNLKEFWSNLEEISNIDNAHAMYLSSNNWEFSVFNDVIENLFSILDNDYQKLNSILCAGVEDVRSSIYTIFDDTWNEVDKEQFYQRIITDQDYIRGNGICPCFAYVTLKTPSLTKVFDKEKHTDSLIKIKHDLNQADTKTFEKYYGLYCKLYYMRLAYDTYEYFGYYSLIRHYAIYKTYDLLVKENSSRADRFKHYASTYQFSNIDKIL